MKGIMVTLLMLMTTGIVVGQQSNSSNNSFTPASAGAQNDLLKPLEIGVSADAIRAIRSGKVLVSKIEPVDPVTGEKLHRNVISGVSLFQEGKNLNTLSKTTVRGRDDGDGVLRFGLTESDLNALANNQLKMDFGASQRGKYQEIEVFYVAPNSNNATSQQPSRPNSNSGVFAPTRPTPEPDTTRPARQLAFGPRGDRGNSSTQTPFIPLPAPAEPGDTNFMGPTLPTAGNWSPPNRTTQNNPALDPNRQNEFANNQTRGGWKFPNQNNGGFQGNTAQDDRQDAIDKMKAKWALEKQQLDYENELRRKNAERLKQEEDDRQLAKWRWEQEQLRNNQARTPLAPILNGPSDNRQLTGEQLAYEKAMWELQRKEDLLKSKEESLLRTIDLAQQKIDASTRQQMYNYTGNQPLRTNQAQDVNPNWDRSNGITPGSHFYPDGPVIERTRPAVSPIDYARNKIGAPDSGFRSPVSNKDVNPRVASNSSRGINNYTAAVAGPGSSNKSLGSNTTTNNSTVGTRDDRVDGFVLFLLLCSLGLNFYLAFISRGFYVRYHELADELRETFSTTH